MKIVFRTNLDLHPETWPEVTHPPEKGDMVRAESGLQLRVVGKIWSKDFVEVELHIPQYFESIKAWEDWYKRFRQRLG